jgi:hypothetical protein
VTKPSAEVFTQSRFYPIVILGTATLALGLFFGVGFFLGGAEAEASLYRHQALWQVLKPTSYTYTVTPICFCPQKPYRVIQRGDDIQVVPDHALDSRQSPPAHVLTIDRAYELALQAIRTAAEVRIQYDETYGYPSDIYIDWDAGSIDDEYQVSITLFSVIPQS